MQILVYLAFTPALAQVREAIARIDKSAASAIAFESDPARAALLLDDLAGRQEPFVLVCGNVLYPRIWDHARAGDLAFAVKQKNPKAYVVVLSPCTDFVFGSDEGIERGTPKERDLHYRLALLALDRLTVLKPPRSA